MVSYCTDSVTLQSVTSDGMNYSYSDDIRMRSIQSSLLPMNYITVMYHNGFLVLQDILQIMVLFLTRNFILFLVIAVVSEEFRFQGFFSVGTLSYAWGKLYRREFLRNHQIYFADLSYAEDKLFNMQCYICDAKYAFLEDIGYIYRKNDMSVSWQYRPDSVENWFKLVYELKSWIEKKDKDPKEYTSLIGYLLIFAAFFDGKMEYMQHKKSLWAVRKVLKKYGSNPMGRKAFTELADRRKKLQITQKLWKIMIRTFSLGMKWRWYLLMSVGIKILVSCRVDERLSDTGIRKK